MENEDIFFVTVVPSFATLGMSVVDSSTRQDDICTVARNSVGTYVNSVGVRLSTF
jgi:hypothetical protein